MKKYFNTSFQNEGILFRHTLPIWKTYDIDKFIFFNDHSTDDGVDVIYSILGKDRAIVLDKSDLAYDDSLCIGRQMMLDMSRKEAAEFVFCLDADELLSDSLIQNMNPLLSNFNNTNILLYWYNIVNYSLANTRQDGYYSACYHPFIIPVNNSGNFPLSSKEHHSFWRTPDIHLPNMAITKDLGIIHLQMINTKYYVYKQLWYKHYELIKYGFNINYINNRYDKNINYLKFEIVQTPPHIINNISFDPSVFDSIIDSKGYREYVKKHYNPELITFGKEYLDL